MSDRVTIKRDELVRVLTDLAQRADIIQGLAGKAECDPADNHLLPAIVAVAGGVGFAVDALLAKLGASDCAGKVDPSDWVHPILAEMTVEQAS